MLTIVGAIIIAFVLLSIFPPEFFVAVFGIGLICTVAVVLFALVAA